MKAIVYVEGPSDRAALEALLRPLLAKARDRRVGVRFIDLGGKAAILDHAGVKAANHLHDDPGDWVFALPDLYPMASYDASENKHRSFESMAALLRARFHQRSGKLGLPADRARRFRVHCLKHDLESLLLAAPAALRRRLGTSDGLKGRWRLPVEDQNDDHPPKHVVAALFQHYRRKKYVDTDDARWILERAELDEVCRACSQRFAPFVQELEIIIEGGSPA